MMRRRAQVAVAPRVEEAERKLAQARAQSSQAVSKVEASGRHLLLPRVTATRSSSSRFVGHSSTAKPKAQAKPASAPKRRHSSSGSSSRTGSESESVSANRSCSASRSRSRRRHRIKIYVEEFLRVNSLEGTAAEAALKKLTAGQQRRVLGIDGGPNRLREGSLKLPENVRNPIAVVMSRIKKQRL